MALSFPNPSRSFDSTRNRIRFWGYDRATEVSFFLEADALQKLCPRTVPTEAGYLASFDAAIARIHKIATKLHSRGGKTTHSFVLNHADC